MNKKILFVIILIFLAIIFAAFYFYKPATTTNAGLDNFAKCLASKNITMYGNYNCPHCLNEKKAFGSSFQYVLYVECTQKPNKCADAGIVGVPTWVFLDGKKLIGEQGLEKLSQESGCKLP
jgi:glutaredoxin